MFDTEKKLRPLLGGSGGSYADANWSVIAHSILCEMSLFISTFVSFMWYPQCLIRPIIEALIWGSRDHPSQWVSSRHPYMIMIGYTIIICFCTHTLVPCSFDQNARGCRFIVSNKLYDNYEHLLNYYINM